MLPSRGATPRRRPRPPPMPQAAPRPRRCLTLTLKLPQQQQRCVLCFQPTACVAWALRMRSAWFWRMARSFRLSAASHACMCLDGCCGIWMPSCVGQADRMCFGLVCMQGGPRGGAPAPSPQVRWLQEADLLGSPAAARLPPKNSATSFSFAPLTASVLPDLAAHARAAC